MAVRRLTALEWVGRLSAKRGLVICTPGRRDLADLVADQLGGLRAGTFSGSAMHTPAEGDREAVAEVVVSVGGGSTTGLGKALPARSGADQVVRPTTCAGPAATPVLGDNTNGANVTRSGPEILWGHSAGARGPPGPARPRRPAAAGHDCCCGILVTSPGPARESCGGAAGPETRSARRSCGRGRRWQAESGCSPSRPSAPPDCPRASAGCP